MDGTLDDTTWHRATEIVDFHQREPYEGRSATERTTVKVLYDKHTLYFGVKCSEPREKIIANELRRDGDYTKDDRFTVLLSPTNDRRSGLSFTVNPVGTQFDALVSEEGKVDDPNWDGVWRSTAQITTDGWEATLAIPFSTLNFKSSSEVTMGINFGRSIRKKNEEDLWQSYLRIFGIDRISRCGELTGLREIGSGRLFVIKPYTLGGFKSSNNFGTDVLHTGGLDFKYGIQSNLVANVTANTDFADADVDPVRFNITPFKVFLPEKRQFFLENRGVFEFGGDNNQPFFSRQIGIDPISGEQVPLDVGGKLTGSLGKFDLGVLGARTRASGPNPYSNYVVGRLKRKVLSESYLGVVGIDKESGNKLDRFNRTAGADADFRFFGKLEFTGFYAKTFSDPRQLREKDWATSLVGSFSSNLVQAEVRHWTVQPNYNPEVGFVERTDIIGNFFDLQLSPRPASGPVREMNFEGFYDREMDTQGLLQTQEWQTTFRANFHNGAYSDDDFFDNFIQRLTTPFNIFGDVVIPSGIYHFDRHQFTYGSDASKRFLYRFFERFGTYYNGSLNEIRVRGNYRPDPRLSFESSETWDRFRFGSNTYNVHVGSLLSSYSFNRFLTTSALAQVNSLERNPVSLNLRLRYNYRPDSDLFVIYNIGSQFNSLAGGNPILTREQRFTVKFTYSFSG